MLVRTIGRSAARLATAAAALSLLAACAALPTLAPGTSREQVTAALGPPSAEFELRPGADTPTALRIDPTGQAVRRLEYSGGTYGKFTRMFDFDANGRLLAGAQVRNEARFNAIRAGMTQDELLRALGHPSNVRGLSFQKQNVWSYRYDSPFCQWFQVGVGYDGKVVDTAYGPDPLCDDDDLFGGLLRGPGRIR